MRTGDGGSRCGLDVGEAIDPHSGKKAMGLESGNLPLQGCKLSRKKTGQRYGQRAHFSFDKKPSPFPGARRK